MAPRLLQELELEGQHIYYDTLPKTGVEYDEKEAQQLCSVMKEIAIESCKTEEEKREVHDMTIEKLEDMGFLYRTGRSYGPIHAFVLMTDNKVR